MPCAPMADWAGLVLAGGASSRMGRDKALLPWNGGTLLDQAIAILADFGADPILVSGNRPGLESIPDQRPGQGPLGGLAAALSARPALAGRWLMVIPVDMPLLDMATLRRLGGAARENGVGAVHDRHPLPLAVRADSELAEAVDAGLSGRASLAGLVDRLRLARVRPENMGALENVNRPGDWDRLHSDFEAQDLLSPAGTEP